MEDLGKMSWAMEDDYGAYLQAPLFYFLRNVCAPSLARLFVCKFTDAEYVRNNLKENETGDLYKLLKAINNKGKRKEGKKAGRENAYQEISRTLHINNLHDNEKLLNEIYLEDLIQGKNTENIVQKLLDLDMTFVLNLLTNKILGYNVDMSSLNKIRIIRNSIFHSGADVGPVKENLDSLCDAMREVYSYLMQDDDLTQQKNTALEKGRHEEWCLPVINDLREELLSKYKTEEINSVFPDVTNSGCQPETSVGCIIKYVIGNSCNQRQRLPVILCGSSGSGKTSILDGITASFYHQDPPPRLALCLRLEGELNERNFWEKSLKNMNNQCPGAVRKHGIGMIEDALTVYRHKILFLVDSNMRRIDDKNFCGNTRIGSWVVTHQGTCEISTAFQTLHVNPLNKEVARNILETLNRKETTSDILESFEKCKYKGLLDTPEMISIFSKCRAPDSCYEMLEQYRFRKVQRFENIAYDLEIIEEAAFKTVLENKTFYRVETLQKVRYEIISCFFLDVRGLKFKYKIMEDYFAARFMAQPQNEDKVADMLQKQSSQIPLLKRVFKFACLLWTENESLTGRYSFIRYYLSELLGAHLEEQEHKRRSKGKREKFMEIDDISRDDSLTKSYNTAFTKWAYLIDIAAACQCNENILSILGDVLAHKKSWIIKCKCLNRDKIEMIGKIFKHVKFNKPITIKLESGQNAVTLNKVMDILQYLPHPEDNKTKITIQMNLIQQNHVTQRQNEQQVVQSLVNLSNKIVKIEHPSLQLCKYVGPFVYTGREEFLKSSCVQNMQILDVSVRDNKSLAEIVACNELPNLRALEVKVDVQSEIEGNENPKTTVLAKDNPPRLTIKFSDGFQALLDSIKQPHHLKYVSLHGVYITENYCIDLKKFEELECLYIRCAPETIRKKYKQNSQEKMEIHRKENSQEKMDMDRSENCQEPMEVDGNEDHGNVVEMLPLSSWTSQLAIQTRFNKKLERIMIRNMSFCDDSNIRCFVSWMSNIKKIMMLDTKVTISGAKAIVDMLQNSEGEGEDDMHKDSKKKCCRSSMPTCKEKCSKQPRVGKMMRDKLFKAKPEGKEIVISSAECLCKECLNFPCSCDPIEGQDTKVSLADLIDLIEGIYKCNLLSCCYFSQIVTVRKNMVGDLRIRMPLLVSDDKLENIESRPLYGLIKSFALAQYLDLEDTQLTLSGAQNLVCILKILKQSDEPFSLVILTKVHPWLNSEIKNSTFIHFLRNESVLSYFLFQCTCCSKCTHSIKKCHDTKIFLNGNEIL